MRSDVLDPRAIGLARRLAPFDRERSARVRERRRRAVALALMFVAGLVLGWCAREIAAAAGIGSPYTRQMGRAPRATPTQNNTQREPKFPVVHPPV